MVKKRVGGAHRYKSVQKSGSSQSPGHEQQKQKHKQQQDAGPKPPSHLQRKITKSVKFYEKVLSQSAPKAPQVSLPVMHATWVCCCLVLSAACSTTKHHLQPALQAPAFKIAAWTLTAAVSCVLLPT
jgi:hypothetical protein